MAAKVKVQIANGTFVELTRQLDGKYKGTVKAPDYSSYLLNDGHYFEVKVQAYDEDIPSLKDEVSVSHATLGEKCKLRVMEQFKPTVNFISPTTGAKIINNMPTIEFNVLDDSNGQSSGFSGIDLGSIELVIDGSLIPASDIIATAITGGYRCSYTCKNAISDGKNKTISIKVSDNDGNESEVKSISISVDTVDPTLNLNEIPQFTAENKVTVSGTTNDATSSPVSVEIVVNGDEANKYTPTVSGTGSFTQQITLAPGVNKIKVTATDSSGKTFSVERTVTYKTDGPVIVNVEFDNVAKCGEFVEFTVTLADD
ncbi:MAG: hypothetical protein NC177_16355 [Ruminococcus flavefaciens]|nr:hypothetical protein [Ruminococcus flavefaciens]